MKLITSNVNGLRNVMSMHKGMVSLHFKAKKWKSKTICTFVLRIL